MPFARATGDGFVFIRIGSAAPFILRALNRQKQSNLIHYTVQERGGHFAAFEQPQLFAAADVNAFGRTLREQGVC
jgi:hypothetical protein